MKRLILLLLIVVSGFLLTSCNKSVKKDNKEQLDRLFTMKNKFDSVSSVQLQTDFVVEYNDEQAPTTYRYVSNVTMKRTPFERYEENTVSRVQQETVDTLLYSQYVAEQEEGLDVYSQKKKDAPFVKLSYTVDEFNHNPIAYPNFVLIGDFIKLVTEDMTIVSDESSSLFYKETPTTRISADLTIELVEKMINQFSFVDKSEELPPLENFKDLVVGSIDFYISDGNELQAIEFNFEKGMIVLKRMGVNQLSLKLTFTEANTLDEIVLPELLTKR